VRDQYREKMDDLISDLDLFYVPPTKGQFTWNNKRAKPGHIAAKIDRFLISSSFLSLHESTTSMILPWSGLYHCPISLIFEHQKNWGPIMFWLNPLWMDCLEFFPIVS
jgi:hypothetical protein